MIKIEKKWHKNCGGKIVYQKPLQEDLGFGKAGYCLKCEQFPIFQEDILFKVEKGYERLMENDRWEILTIEDLKEDLEGVPKLKDLSKFLKEDYLKKIKQEIRENLVKKVGNDFTEEEFENAFQKTIKNIDKEIQNKLKNAMIDWKQF